MELSPELWRLATRVQQDRRWKAQRALVSADCVRYLIFQTIKRLASDSKSLRLELGPEEGVNESWLGLSSRFFLSPEGLSRAFLLESSCTILSKHFS